MPVPHLEIRIVQRSKGSSAVAGAAYQAGEKLFSEYDQKMKNYLYKKEVVYTEVMLPTNAPPRYADRATLWNAAEDAEKQWNSQLARRFVVALPREAPTAMYPQMMQEYCQEHFVSKGMCCDFAIHDPDPPGHNPHCHIMLTMRAIDENGKWLPKSRKVYDLDENGERIRLPSGNWKSHKEDTVDWNEQYHAEEWRHGWEIVQNKYLELAGSPERVDMRSYERQGLDKIPTVHMGAAVCALERKGIETNIGNLNRDIKAANRMMNAIRSTIRNLRNWIADIMEAAKEALAETEAQAKNTSPDLVFLLRDYLNLRKAERSDWSRYGQQKGTTDDLKAVSKAIIYLKEHELFTLEDLDAALQGMSEKSKGINAAMKKASARMKVITGIQNAVADCQTHKAVHDKYLKIGWKARQAAFAESHKDELDSFNKAFRYLKKQGVDLNVNLDSLQAEYSKLQTTYAELSEQLAAANIREDVVRYEYGAAVGVEPDYAAPHIHGGQGHDKGRDVGPGYHKPVHRTEDRARGQAYGYRRIDGQPVICHEAAHEAARNGYDRADREVDAANEYRHCQAAGEDDVHGYLPCYVEQVAGGEELFGDPGDDREQHEYQRKSAENAQKFPYPSQLPAEPGLFCLFHVASPFSRAA